MTNDQILAIKQEARVAAAKLEAGGLDTTPFYHLINSSIAMLADDLMRTKWEKEQVIRRVENFDPGFGSSLRTEYAYEIG